MSKICRLPVVTTVFGMTMVLLSSQEMAAAAAQQPDRVEVGQEAPRFELDSLDGEPVSLESLRGESALILIFFRGTW